jgi:hypothetical protein
MLHGGTVTVADLGEGAGTRIEVRLPMADRPAERPAHIRSWLAAPHR